MYIYIYTFAHIHVHIAKIHLGTHVFTHPPTRHHAPPNTRRDVRLGACVRHTHARDAQDEGQGREPVGGECRGLYQELLLQPFASAGGATVCYHQLNLLTKHTHIPNAPNTLVKYTY